MRTPRVFLNCLPQIAQTEECSLTGDLISDVCSKPEASGETKAGSGSQSGVPTGTASGFPDASVPAIGRLHHAR